ncbi:SAFB-like transcription modulator isoform X2 [Leptotrombidium deliense]|uniref:SAFB-like transcription modulator isoform X2 n=1 Tax=Leptotrombidium deliense TaxID=299467 RepID=A0A443SK88_9ACAR|nr:SAFB-like transcription modulator isoform X2 [Leptotrombidium deliense]
MDSPSKEDSEKGDSDKKDDSDEKDKKDDEKKSKDRRSRERSRSGERKFSISPFRKMINRRPVVMRRPMMRRPMGSFLSMRRNFRTMPVGVNANPVLLRRIETERAIRRRERERELRETENRRLEVLRHQREVERKNQEEKERLEREKEKLRLERERLEREKAEMLRLEREKVRLERERFEKEREELRRRQAQLPHRLDDTSRARTTTGPKRVYEQRAEFETYWEERKRPATRFDAQQNTSGRTFNESGPASRFSDFDARNSHGNTFDGRGDYKRTKLDIPSANTSRGEYEIRRDSQRHGGHDRDDRRTSGSGQSAYYRESARGGIDNRNRERRTGGREDWKPMHENRRERYMEKTVASGVASYGSNPRSFVGGDRSEWSSTERTSTAASLGKLTYNNTSIGDSRSRQPGLNTSIIGGSSNTLTSLFGNNAGLPMGGIMSHAGIGANTSLNSGDRYLHQVRRFN